MDKLLKKHIWLECKYGNLFTSIRPLNETINNILAESGGVMKDIDKYLSSLEEAVKKDISDKEKGEYTFIYGRDIFNFEPFFDTCEITVNIHLNDGIEVDNSGEYKSGLSGWKENSYHIYIILNAWGNKETILNQLRISFSHELTHAYDDYGRRRLNSKSEDIITSGIKNGKYNASQLVGFDKSTQFQSIYRLMYFCSNTEINGYIAQIKEEIRNYFKSNHPVSSNDIYEAITHTQVYKLLKDYESEVEALNRISLSDYNNLKEMAVNSYNSINKKNNNGEIFS